MRERIANRLGNLGYVEPGKPTLWEQTKKVGRAIEDCLTLAPSKKLKVEKIILHDKEVIMEGNCFAPAPCPVCGTQVEVPLTRNPIPGKCYQCNAPIFTMGIGLVNTDEEKLRYIYDEVTMWVHIANAEWNEKKKITK